MKLIRGIQNITPAHHGCVLAIGNFDGVHRGHQALLANLRQMARALNVPARVMIFEPQPLELFAAEKAPARLTRLREKLLYLARYGVDEVLCVRFSRHFASISAQNFIDQLLVSQLGVRFLTVGDDFHFGAGRQGDFSLLQQAGQRYGFAVQQSQTFCDGSMRISSTAVRQALKADDLPLAERLLGHSLAICGRVAHGEELGRRLGFPTANLPLHRQVCPITGVFAAEVIGIDEDGFYGNACCGNQVQGNDDNENQIKPNHFSKNELHNRDVAKNNAVDNSAIQQITPALAGLPAVANIGTRPTVNGGQAQLEVHLLDFNQNLYGRHIQVILRKKLRDEQRFASLDKLKAQIAQDASAAREFFRRYPAKQAAVCNNNHNYQSEYGIETHE